MARKELEQVKLLFEAAVTSTTYRAYLDREMVCRKFYDSYQWTQDEISELTNRGQTPVVINKIRNRIKGLCGTEVVNRTRIGYGARSFRPEDADTADALSQIALYVQDKGNVAFQRSRTFEDALTSLKLTTKRLPLGAATHVTCSGTSAIQPQTSLTAFSVALRSGLMLKNSLASILIRNKP